MRILRPLGWENGGDLLDFGGREPDRFLSAEGEGSESDESGLKLGTFCGRSDVAQKER